MEILIDNRQTRIEIDLDELQRKTEKILEELGCSTAAVISIVLVNSPEIASLNLKYRGKEGPSQCSFVFPVRRRNRRTSNQSSR